MRGKVAELSKSYRGMALQFQQSSHDVAETAQFMITTGIGDAAVSKLLPIIAKAATAYNTPLRETAQGAFSMLEQTDIPLEQMSGALSATALAAEAPATVSFADFSALIPRADLCRRAWLQGSRLARCAARFDRDSASWCGLQWSGCY